MELLLRVNMTKQNDVTTRRYYNELFDWNCYLCVKKNSPMLQQDVTTTTCLLLSIKKKGRQLNQVMTAALECNETKPSHLRKPSAVVLTNQNELVLLE